MSPKDSRDLLPTAIALGLLILALDAITPLGVADGLLYPIVLVLGLRAEDRRFPVLLAFLASAFVLLGAWLSPRGAEAAIGLVNRGFSLAIVWLIAALLWRYKATERAERAAEKNAQAYLDVADVAILVLDREGCVRLVNRRGCELLERGPEEILGKDWFGSFVPERIRERSAAAYARLMRGEARLARRLEKPVVTATGSERIVAWNSTPLWDDEGGLRGILSSGEDVTETRRVEDALRQSEASLRRAQELGHMGSYERGADGEPTFWSRELFCILGLPPASAPLCLEEYLSEVVHPDDRAAVRTAMERAMVRGGAYEVAYRIVRPDGAVRYVHSVGEPVVREGRVIKVEGMLLDVTDRRKAEEALREAERRLDAVIANAPVALFATDAASRITLARGKALGWLGLSAETSVGRTLHDLHPSSSWMAVNVRRALEGKAFATEGELSGRSFELSYTPMTSDAGGVIGVIGVGLDVTDRRKAEDLVRERAALARLGEMAAVVAHEVKNPLAGIAGAIGIISCHLPPDSPDQKAIQSIMARIDALDGMIQDLLLFARPKEPSLAEVRPQALLRDAASLLARDPQGSGVTVEIGGDDPVLSADADLMREVFLNLLLNSAQAMRAGTVTVSLAARDGRCRLSVRDQGPGIPEEIRDRVFEPFFTTKHRGTGLGLSIARRVVEAHGGAIEIDGSGGQGTTVIVDVPIARGG